MTTVKVKSTEKQNKEIIHKIGNWYEHKSTKELYVLCNQGYCGINLVCVNDGESWTSPIPVDNHYNDVIGRMKEILDNGEFEFIESVTITKD